MQIHILSAPVADTAGAVSAVSNLSRDSLVSVIHALVSGIAGADMAPDTPLSHAGLDSLASVEFRNDLSR